MFGLFVGYRLVRVYYVIVDFLDDDCWFWFFVRVVGWIEGYIVC